MLLWFLVQCYLNLRAALWDLPSSQRFSFERFFPSNGSSRMDPFSLSPKVCRYMALFSILCKAHSRIHWETGEDWLMFRLYILHACTEHSEMLLKNIKDLSIQTSTLTPAYLPNVGGGWQEVIDIKKHEESNQNPIWKYSNTFYTRTD